MVGAVPQDVFHGVWLSAVRAELVWDITGFDKLVSRPTRPQLYHEEDVGVGVIHGFVDLGSGVVQFWELSVVNAGALN